MESIKNLLKSFLVKCGHIYKYHKDEELVNLFISNNDECALEELFNRYVDKIYGIVLRITKDVYYTEDVIQEVFLTLSQKLHTFRGDSSFSTWLFRITTNAAYMKLRSEKKFIKDYGVEDEYQFTHGKTNNPVNYSVSNWSNHPEVNLFKKEALEILDEAMIELPESYRVVIHLKDIEGFSYKEIAEILNITIPAVKSRIHRSRLTLRDLLSEYFYDWRNK